MSRNGRRCRNLHAVDPHCHWCGEATVLDEARVGGKQYPRDATVDHLRDRFDPKRWVPARSREVRTVLACFECNNRRSHERQRGRPQNPPRGTVTYTRYGMQLLGDKVGV